MASKKKLKERVKREQHVGDELFQQVQMLSGQLREIDELLVHTELPGPTIEAWAMQVRDLLSSLVKARGIVSGSVYQAYCTHAPTGASAPFVTPPDGSPYVLLRDEDLRPFPQETLDAIYGSKGPTNLAPFGDGRHGDFLR